MPLTKSGKKVKRKMKEEYGEKGEAIFYATMNKGKKGSGKWHRKSARKT